MTTKLIPTDLLDNNVGVREKTDPVDWQRAFVVLVALTCSGFVQSLQVERWVQTIRDEVDPRAADVMIAIFNRTRSQWMQDFMG